MTRTYIAKRLFEHGPLKFREFAEITGWPTKAAYSTINQLMMTGIIKFKHQSRCGARVYSLA